MPFARSPGGTPEIGAREAWAHRCAVRFVDVRERHELSGALEHVPGAAWVPLRQLSSWSETLAKHEAVVLVCRSGRRSGSAARYLADRGFARVGAVTGGMLAWRQAGLPTSGEPAVGTAPERASPPPEAEPHPLDVPEVEIHLGDERRVRWTKVASLLLQGHESCVDGRDAHAVLGTPGGDAGELLLALAATEALTGRALGEATVARVFRDYVEAFGTFYMHTDRHALDTLEQIVASDPELAEASARLTIEGLVRQCPEALESRLLAQLLRAEAIGCGHLRLIRQSPDAYGVRPALLEALLSAFFTALWRGHPALDFEVLEGEHAERGVLTVRIEEEIAPFTPVPMVVPRLGAGQMFVAHPQVTAFVRAQNVAFLLRESLFEDLVIDRAAVLTTIEELAQRQLQLTMAALARGLPAFEAVFREGEVEVRRLEDEAL